MELYSVTGLMVTCTFIIRAISRGITTVIGIIVLTIAVTAVAVTTASAVTTAIQRLLLLTTAATAAVVAAATVLTLRSSPCTCSVLFVSCSQQLNVSNQLCRHASSYNEHNNYSTICSMFGVHTCVYMWRMLDYWRSIRVIKILA
jgi:hypothetical protein